MEFHAMYVNYDRISQKFENAWIYGRQEAAAAATNPNACS